MLPAQPTPITTASTGFSLVVIVPSVGSPGRPGDTLPTPLPSLRLSGPVGRRVALTRRSLATASNPLTPRGPRATDPGRWCVVAPQPGDGSDARGGPAEYWPPAFGADRRVPRCRARCGPGRPYTPPPPPESPPGSSQSCPC